MTRSELYRYVGYAYPEQDVDVESIYPELSSQSYEAQVSSTDNCRTGVGTELQVLDTRDANHISFHYFNF